VHSILYPSHTRIRKTGRRPRAAQRWSVRARVLALIFALAALVALTASKVDLGRPARTITIPSGARLVAALDDAISTATATPGQRVVLETVEPLVLDNGAKVPAGIVVRGEVTVARAGGRAAGEPELAIKFTEMEIEGQIYPIEAEPLRVRGRSDEAGVAATRGDQIVLPDAQRIPIRLSRPVTIQYSGKSATVKP